MSRPNEQVVLPEASLQDSDVQLRRLVAGVTDYAIYMLDAQGIIISWNVGAERVKGYTAREIIGRHVSTFYTPEDRAAGVAEHALETARRTGKYEAEAWRVRKDGSHFWASVMIDAIYEHGRLVGFAKVTRDMTERRALQEQLMQSQKMEAIGQLTGGLAHDFNNLLTVIIGNLESISRHLPTQSERLRRAVEQAGMGAQRAATLTQQLLAFARRQPLNPKSIDVNSLVGGMSDLLRRTLGELVTIETTLGAGLWWVEADPNQLESALLNLAVNGRDAMPEGGTLTIRTSNAPLGASDAVVAGVPPGEYVLICVSDTGVGMSPDQRAHVFEPFFTTKPIGRGTGLGLSQVYGFVAQSGGHVTLESEPGQGTTLKVYLPRQSDPGNTARDSAPVECERGGTESILVVEDDVGVRTLTTDGLRELGYTVLEATDGPGALRLLEQHPQVQLLFTDVGLPGMNGRQLAEAALNRCPELRVLFTSGYERAALTRRGRLDHGIELLAKPFNRAQLAAAVRAVLDRPPSHVDMMPSG